MKDKDTNHKDTNHKKKIWPVIFLHVFAVVLAPLQIRRRFSEWKRTELQKHATKMHKILYKCPCCYTEMHMHSWKSWLWCDACGSRWLFWKNRRVLPLSTRIAFRTRDEWKNWERDCVREEIKNGNYHFTDTVRVKIETSSGEHLDWGYGTLTHTPEYMLLECRYGNEDYTLIRSSHTLDSLPFELGKEGKADYVELNSAAETFLCYLNRKDAAVKLSMAVEECYRKEGKTK